ncbi:hypothetical protein FHR81_002975 [Actinoalloteichus hoggarensis]|uniref:Uncharacterized protein n=1 Tax=Actinoalloteichus hoggarensis TaxID=1470176 RepID=A0A221VYJ4_9PSEU|nr:hypothetical protein [Actinoalloteichus hoggarensis]ASO18567.1 hypothetical protein AHOG_04555 [Actinoalloteichus hoggarensis]MBB5921935.1 hypothetical protein [Actinoalloteichus hoggarensis]
MTSASKTVEMTEQASTAGRLLRGVSGSITAGLVILALFLIVAQLVASRAGYPGPGMAAVVAHSLAAIGAVPLQRSSDRRRTAVRWWGPLAIMVMAGVVLWFWWWQ